MQAPLGSDQRRLLAQRGYTRRDLARLAALLTAGASLPFYNEATLAQGLSALPNLSADAVRINANENPMGPCAEALEAVAKVASSCGRYLYGETTELIRTLAGVEGLSPESVLAFAGSSDPLHRSVIAYTSPSKSLVIAEPGYEAGEKAARYVGAKVIHVPLRADGSHDVRAMATADPDAGLIYICNPNNPTGSVTKKEDIDYIVANKPKDAVVLLDEAYIHLSDSAETGVPHVVADKDVVILRTFSKLYGMAGLRAGAAFGRPDLLEKIQVLGAGALPVTGMVAASASLKVKNLVPKRRKVIADIRNQTAEWLDKKGYTPYPSEANMLMFCVKRPGREVFNLLLKEKVAIGRTWASKPDYVRVSIGTAEEMAKFRAAFARVMNA